MMALRRLYGFSTFQSTFPRGERPCSRIISPKFSDFNPRSRVGNDQIPDILKFYSNISIHVPAWGTTMSKSVFRITPKFQSTFPRGERQSMGFNTGNTLNFNPRSRVGNDGIFLSAFLIRAAFQSTFPRGERRSYQCSVPCC